MSDAPGPLVLFGSGETARSGRQVHEEVLSRFPRPVRVAILPTPAGFQPNADAVAGRLAEFVLKSLVNHRPEVVVVDAKRRGGDRSGAGDPDDPRVAVALEGARYVFAGPGSPTYMVRQLAGTLTWAAVQRAWRAGAGVALASAAAVAVGAHALPVYEIYKAGEDLGWRRGLDLCAEIGLELAIVPHWNNTEGGAGLDTSRCYIGRDRFERLRELLPPSAVVLGLDEHTSCIVDVTAGTIEVRGQGILIVLRGQEETVVLAGQRATTDLLRRVAVT
ncbi:MAG: cysteinyl-tRNA synthetase [Chloroflexota bacterium]|nr:cysteinyl-tRNA synthetase [Chloroflexota bacterium]